MLVKLTSMLMSNSQIIHVDMDAFFASVEIRDDPKLAGLPVAVGGKAEGRGVISAASYEARQFGVHSAMATATAFKQCPDLVLVSPNFDRLTFSGKPEWDVPQGWFVKGRTYYWRVRALDAISRLGST